MRPIITSDGTKVSRIRGLGDFVMLSHMVALWARLPIELCSWAGDDPRHTYVAIRDAAVMVGVAPVIGVRLFERLKRIGAFRQPRAGVYRKHPIPTEFWVGSRKITADHLLRP